MNATQQPPALIRVMAGINRYLGEDFLGGPRLLKMAHVINLQKGATAFFIGGLMWFYENTSTAAWIYLAMHGSYGFCWLLKDVAFPDANWQKRITFGGALMCVVLVLGPYWVAPWLLISGVLGARPEPTNALLAGVVALHTLGVATMLSADAQKYFTLRHRRGLIDDGMFRFVRHPNYLGEMMIYSSYALLVGHWIPWAILAWVWIQVFLPNMLMKEASLSRHPGWAAYRARTGMLLPWPFARPAQGAGNVQETASPTSL